MEAAAPARRKDDQAFLHFDMNALRGWPCRFLASACFEQSSDLAVRGALLLLAGLAAGFAAGLAAVVMAGLAAGLTAAAFMRAISDGLAAAGAALCAITGPDISAAARATIANFFIFISP